MIKGRGKKNTFEIFVTTYKCEIIKLRPKNASCICTYKCEIKKQDWKMQVVFVQRQFSLRKGPKEFTKVSL